MLTYTESSLIAIRIKVLNLDSRMFTSSISVWSDTKGSEERKIDKTASELDLGMLISIHGKS
jgi:hypothetical protein